MGINYKIDADTIMASLMRRNGQTFQGRHGVTYMPNYADIVVKYVGDVRKPSGMILRAENFYKVAPWQDHHARELVRKLNAQLHHDGAWAVMWTNPTPDGMPTEIKISFQDVDGDPQFVIDCERTLADLMTTGPESHMENCERAYQQWKQWQVDMEISPNQKIKWGQGQEQRDPHDQPLI